MSEAFSALDDDNQTLSVAVGTLQKHLSERLKEGHPTLSIKSCNTTS